MTNALELELSHFIVELDWADVPAPVQARVIDIWADTVANAIAGRRAANTMLIERLANRLCGHGESTVIGGGTASPTAAALVNGHQITAFTMCDVYRPALCHITPEVVPAVLAAAEQVEATGRELLTGLTVGLEITARLGQGVDYPNFRRRGWHAPGVIGTVGAACAAARVIGLDDRQIRAAMGLGVSQASGTFAALGTSAVKFHQARGAVSGLWAAMFTADGLGGTENGLTHPDGGLLNTYVDGGQPELVTRELGSRWELEQISLRRWPAASSLQSLVAVMLGLPDSVAVQDRFDATIEIALPPTSFVMCAEMGWQDELSAMQSARYVAAVVWHERACWIEQFDTAHRTAPALTGFATNRVSVACDDSLPQSGVGVRLTAGGDVTVVRRDQSPGEPDEPLMRRQIYAKLDAACATTAITAAGRLDDVVHRLGERRADQVCVDLRAPTTAAPSAATAEGSIRDFASQ